MEKFFEIGVITGTHGIRGTMRVFPTTQDPSRFERLKEVTVENKGKQEIFHIKKVAFHKKFVLLTVKEITDINAAELYKNARLLIPDAEAIPLEADEYYTRDLYGLRVVTDEGAFLRNKSITKWNMILIFFPSSFIATIKNKAKRSLASWRISMKPARMMFMLCGKRRRTRSCLFLLSRIVYGMWIWKRAL